MIADEDIEVQAGMIVERGVAWAGGFGEIGLTLLREVAADGTSALQGKDALQSTVKNIFGWKFLSGNGLGILLFWRRKIDCDGGVLW